MENCKQPRQNKPRVASFIKKANPESVYRQQWKGQGRKKKKEGIDETITTENFIENTDMYFVSYSILGFQYI